MYRIYLIFSIFFNVSCQQPTKNRIADTTPLVINSSVELKKILKEDLFLRCKKYDSTYHVYSMTISKLNFGSIIFLRPVTYYEYLKERGPPFFAYSYNDILFLVYSGMEDILIDNDFVLVKNQYDSVCKKYNIGSLSFAYDKEPLFLKLQADTLSTFYDSDFHLLFYDKKYIKYLK